MPVTTGAATARHCPATIEIRETAAGIVKLAFSLPPDEVLRIAPVPFALPVPAIRPVMACTKDTGVPAPPLARDTHESRKSPDTPVKLGIAVEPGRGDGIVFRFFESIKLTDVVPTGGI
jgi:hypothetical protein